MAEEAALPSPHDVMGHGGHAGMSMEAMVRDMRNRFLVAAVLSIPILLWSRIGREVLGFTVAAPFGLSDNWFQLLLSLPVVFYSGWVFFDGAYRALRNRTLDMMVLVAVAIGAGWVYSVEHLQLFSIAPKHTEDLLFGYPMALLLGIAGSVVLSRS